jgi:hypothetical protein
MAVNMKAIYDFWSAEDALPLEKGITTALKHKKHFSMSTWSSCIIPEIFGIILERPTNFFVT